MRFEELGGRFIGFDAGQAAAAYGISGVGGELVAASLVELSLTIVREGRGPMRLWEFAHRLRQRLGMPPVPTSELCDAVKAALEAATASDTRLTVLATSMPGVGYVFEAGDRDAWPVGRRETPSTA